MKTILLVDDESALVETLTDLLEQEGYRVVSAENGHAGLVLLQDARPDLVLVDRTMPVTDGGEFVRSMRALPEFRLTPVVMMSAMPTSSCVPDLGAEEGVSAFVSKPFRWEKILDAIVRLIGKGAGSA